MAEKIQHNDIVPETCLGKRLDQTIAIMFPDYSRTRLKDWILAGHVCVNDQVVKKKKIVGTIANTVFINKSREKI